MRVIDETGNNLRVVTESGQELECVPVRRMPVQDLLVRMGVTDVKKEDLKSLGQVMKNKPGAAEAAMSLFNYCMGFGVTTDPTPAQLDEVRLITSSNSPNVIRATWLNYFVLKDVEEAGILAGLIMALTFRDDGPPTENLASDPKAN